MRYFIITVLVCISGLAFAQDGTARKQAEAMGNALVRKDYKTFVTFTYPKIMREMGGAEKMASAIEQQMKGMEQTAQILSITYGDPSPVIKEGKELQCTVPQQMILKTAQGKILSKSTLIGISADNGAHWYFVDAGERDINSVRTSLPNVSKKLVLPKPELPQFLKD